MYYKISMNPQGKYYPKSITKGKVISAKKIAEKLAQISTVSEADARAVLSMLGEVMTDYLASGRQRLSPTDLMVFPWEKEKPANKPATSGRKTSTEELMRRYAEAKKRYGMG